MSLHSISSKNKKAPTDPVGFWGQGFRPFFFGASIFSIVAMFIWALIYSGKLSLTSSSINILQWHAHQMIFGYCMAVVAGFLLTAVPNWTGTKSISNLRLILVFCSWAVARVLSVFGTEYLWLCLVCDGLFVLLLLFLIIEPIYKTRSWQQLGVLSKVLLLAACNLAFYLNALGFTQSSANWGIYGGFYLIIGLILTISARVYPNFVRIAVNYPVKIEEPKILRDLSLWLFLLFFLNELILVNADFSVFMATVLFIIYSYRLFVWYTHGIWNKPLLWSLYLAVCFINLGFLLLAVEPISGISKFIAIHCMALGGIGFATLGFMARVSLGHSGKSVHYPPKYFIWVLRLLLAALFFRVLMPVLQPAVYPVWILHAQVIWIIAFLCFICLFIRYWFNSAEVSEH